MKSGKHHIRCLALLPLLSLPVARVQSSDSSPPTFLKTYCTDCHNDTEFAGKLIMKAREPWFAEAEAEQAQLVN